MWAEAPETDYCLLAMVRLALSIRRKLHSSGRWRHAIMFQENIDMTISNDYIA